MDGAVRCHTGGLIIEEVKNELSSDLTTSAPNYANVKDDKCKRGVWLGNMID